MKKKIQESIKVPEGITCEIKESKLTCKKDGKELSRSINLPNVKLEIKDNSIIFSCDKGNKNDFKMIKSILAHVANIFHGLQEDYTYSLEAANVHFPMTLKVDGQDLIISNFLGEKVVRKAKILDNVKVEVKGQKITISSPDKEAAGQTAANIEKATKVSGRDRRIFQDGIYITAKPRRVENA